MSVNIKMFSKASGDILGVGHVEATLGNKEHVLANVTFYDGHKPAVSFSRLPSKEMGLGDLEKVIDGLTAFLKAIEEKAPNT
jgi:prepilin-type processing-associated H-X9-DG protein